MDVKCVMRYVWEKKKVFHIFCVYVLNDNEKWGFLATDVKICSLERNRLVFCPQKDCRLLRCFERNERVEAGLFIVGLLDE